MAKPCAVFWDIQNVGIPKGQSANSIIKLIRSTIVKPFNLNEIFFFCVCDVNKLPFNFGNSLTTLDIDIVQAYNNVKDSADMKISNLMRKFVKFSGQDCTIILISGDGDYYGTLNDLKKLYNVSIHLIRLANSFSFKLDKIADYIFILNNGTLTPVKSTGSPMYFISISNYPLTMEMRQVMSELNAQAIGSIQNSAILYNNLICIGFPILWNAEKAIEKLNGSRFHGCFLKVELLNDSPLTNILRNLKPQTKAHEAKIITFVQIKRFDKFLSSPGLTSLPHNQCILFSKSFIWLVFLFKSDAEKCLPKVKIAFPDAVISEPPIDLTYTSHESPYTIKLTNQIVSDVKSNELDKVTELNTNESEIHIHDRFSDILNSHDLKLSDKISTLKELTQLNGVIDPSFNYRVTDQWKLVFYQKPEKNSHLTTKWSLIHNLFAQFYHLGSRKVCYDGRFYWVHFDCEESYEYALDKRERLNFASLGPIVPLSSPSQSAESIIHEITDQMNRYNANNPWCFLPDLELYCYMICLNIEFHADFIAKSKDQLNDCECIFIKSFLGKIWLGFPNKYICKESEKYVNQLLFNSRKPTKPIVMVQPTKKLLESIELKDLIGEAFDLAFFSNELVISRKLNEYKNSKIIQQLNLQSSLFLKTDQQCDKPLFYLTISGLEPFQSLDDSKLIKILVKLSKVIPMAALTSLVQVPMTQGPARTTTKVSFILSSLVEVRTMLHYLRNIKLGYSNSPFTVERYGLFSKQKLNTLDYFTINDQRKVLEKIIQNQILMDKLNSNSSAVESTSDIDVLNEELTKQIQYLYTITTDSEFKFTSGMISIIKMHLIQMDCPACVEFEDKIWVGIEDLDRGNKAKAEIDQIKFKILHENDEDDFEATITMNLISSFPSKVIQMMIKKLRNSSEPKRSDYMKCDVDSFVPLGHFNYCYKKAMQIDCSHSYDKPMRNNIYIY